MTNDTVLSYIAGLIVIVIALFVLKKVASCLIRTVVTLIALVILAAIAYMMYH